MEGENGSKAGRVDRENKGGPWLTVHSSSLCLARFNTLQIGVGVATWPIRWLRCPARCFNTLQIGVGVATHEIRLNIEVRGLSFNPLQIGVRVATFQMDLGT